ncbi:MAG: hypothetical protein EBX52_05220 [Proteobacteria bacterium]|nr:hypothetical protein [Pseudomonadota bacterium]
MNAPNPLSLLITLDHALPIRWDGRSPLVVGHPGKFLIENTGKEITIRPITREPGRRPRTVKRTLESLLAGTGLDIAGLGALRFSRLAGVVPVEWEGLAKLRAPLLPARAPVEPSDRTFASNLRKGMGLFAVMLFALFLLPKPAPVPEETPSRPLVRLVRAPSTSHANSRNSGSASVFQNRAVKASLSSMLSGSGSNANLAKALSGSLNRSLNGSLYGSRAAGALGALPSLSGSLKGSAQASGPPSVRGQGKGQLEIGLDTSEAAVDEGLTREEVARVIHAHLNEIRYCYESGILHDPTLSGKLLVDFQINGSGHVPEAGISEATLNGGGVGPCLLSKLRSWKFPEPRGGVKVAIRYPFIFKSLSR